MSAFSSRVLTYLRPHRLPLLWALVQVLLIGVCELLKPWPLKVVIDSVLGGQAPPRGWPAGWSPEALLLAACAALVLIYAVLGTLTVLNNFTTIRVGQRMVSELRSDLYSHLHRLSLAFHSRAQVGDLLYRVTADTFALQSLTMNSLFPAVTALILLVGMSVIMLRLDWTLTLLALGVCPALFAAIARLNARLTRVAGEVRRHESEVYAVVQQTMSTMRVIQAFTREEDEHRRFMTANRQSLAAGLRLYTLQTFYSSVVNVVIALGTAAVVWVGARHVLDGSLSLGSLVIFVSYLASLYGPINSLFQTYGFAQGSRAGVQRVFDVLDVEREIADGADEFPSPGAVGEVAWESVSFAYTPGRPVLAGVTLRVRPGQKVAIAGPTGAGKSTLLSLLPRFYDPTAGRLVVDGRDAREYRLASLRRQIAMVLQPPLVFPTTLRDNIAFGRPGARPDEIISAARLACIDDMIMRLPRGYETLVGEQGVTLSEGEKQRLTIARAILRNSPILILDEPTSSVDAETEFLILQGLERLTAGRTTFIIAHRLSTVRKADLIVVLRDGHVVEQGGFEALMEARGTFASLYRLQDGVRKEDPLALP
ncbi:MAG: ABC transporter ATP-binding protein [Candidatus Rokubacteria bacterium]|nr:ABC transporter ATP-binding protein [Candidatus Rokubacteria bacterium]